MEFSGFALGAMGFIFSLSALTKIRKLEKQLKDSGVLDESYEKEQ